MHLPSASSKAETLFPLLYCIGAERFKRHSYCNPLRSRHNAVSLGLRQVPHFPNTYTPVNYLKSLFLMCLSLVEYISYPQPPENSTAPVSVCTASYIIRWVFALLDHHHASGTVSEFHFKTFGTLEMYASFLYVLICMSICF